MMHEDALLRVVKATRLSLKMAAIMRMMYSDNNVESYADTVAELLIDALTCIGREELEIGQDFLEDSQVYKLLNSDMDDIEVTNRIAEMAKPPKPQTIERDEMERMYRENGGYMAGG